MRNSFVFSNTFLSENKENTAQECMTWILRAFTECDVMVKKHLKYLKTVAKLQRMLKRKRIGLESRMIAQIDLF